MAPDALTLGEIDAFYGDSHVLQGVSVRLRAGRLLGLLGRNGAGKTTSMNVAVGLLPPHRGRLSVYGVDMTGAAPEAIAAEGVALVPQGRRIFRSLSVRENLAVAARRATGGEAAPWTLEAVFKTFPRLRERASQVAGHLSGGEQQMLAIGRGLMAEPELLMLDEPSLGLSPLLVEELFTLIKTINAQGIALLIVEQNVVQSLEVAQRAYILDNGRFVLEGAAAELAKDPKLKHAYLGL